jgi:hypothetical protein
MFIAHITGGSTRYVVSGGFAHAISNNSVLAEWKTILTSVSPHGSVAAFDFAITQELFNTLFIF